MSKDISCLWIIFLLFGLSSSYLVNQKTASDVYCITMCSNSSISLVLEGDETTSCPCDENSNCMLTFNCDLTYNNSILEQFNSNLYLNITNGIFEVITSKNVKGISFYDSTINGIDGIELEYLNVLTYGIISGNISDVICGDFNFSILSMMSGSISDSNFTSINMDYTYFYTNMSNVHVQNFFSNNSILNNNYFIDVTAEDYFYLLNHIQVYPNENVLEINSVKTKMFWINNVVLNSGVFNITSDVVLIQNSQIPYIYGIVSDDVSIESTSIIRINNINSTSVNLDDIHSIYSISLVGQIYANILGVEDLTIDYFFTIIVPEVDVINSNIGRVLSCEIENFNLTSSEVTLVDSSSITTLSLSNVDEFYTTQTIISNVTVLNNVVFTGDQTINSFQSDNATISGDLTILNIVSTIGLVLDGNVNATISTPILSVVSGISNITISSPTSISILDTNVSLIINTYNSPLLSFDTLQCYPSVHINPLDYFSPSLEVSKVTDNCINTILIDTSIPFESEPDCNNCSLGCDYMAIVSNSFTLSSSSEEYHYDNYYSDSIQNLNQCPPKICLYASSDVSYGYYSCLNGYLCSSDCSLVVTSSFISLFLSVDELLLSPTVEMVSSLNDISINSVYIADATDVVFRNNAYTISDVKETLGYLTLSNTTFETSILNIPNILVSVFSTLNATSIITTNIVTTMDSSVNTDILNAELISFDSVCFITNTLPIYYTKQLIVSSDNWMVVSGCYLEYETVPLLFCEQEIDFATPTNSNLYCNNHMVVTLGTNGNSQITCGIFGISQTCYVIGEDLDIEDSYDMTKSTASECPCNSTDYWGVHIECDNFIVEFTLTVSSDSSLTSSNISIETLTVTGLNTFTFNSPSDIHMIIGDGKVISSELINVHDVFLIQLMVSEMNVSGTFNPSTVYLNNSHYNLLTSCMFFTNLTTFSFIEQSFIPFDSYITTVFGFLYTVIENFPLNSCQALISINESPTYAFWGAVTPSTYDYELTCEKSLVIICNDPLAKYQCPEEICYVTNPSEKISSSSAYNDTNCPCGFSTSTLKYSESGCVIVSTELDVLDGVYGNFKNILHGPYTTLSLSNNLTISKYTPTIEQTFSSSSQKFLDLTVITTDSYSLNLNCQSTVLLSGDEVTIISSNTLNLYYSSLNSLLLTASDEVTFPEYMNIPIHLIIQNTIINIPYGLTTESIVLETNGLVNPLFVIGENMIFSSNSFEYVGNDTGYFVQSTEDTIQVTKLINAYVNDACSYLATEQLDDTIYCGLTNGTWNNTICPCSGEYCHIIIIEEEEIISLSFIGIGELWVYGVHEFTSKIQSNTIIVLNETVFYDVEADFINCTSSSSNGLILYSYEINRTIGNNYHIIVYGEGTIYQLEGYILSLYINKTMTTKYINAEYLVLHEKANILLLNVLTGGTFTADNVIIYLPLPFDEKYYLIRSDSLPPLDQFSIYGTPSSSSTDQVMYLTVVCNNYLTYLNDPNDGSCPTTEDSSSNNKYLFILLVIPFFLLLLVPFVIIGYLLYHKHRQRTHAFDPLF
ncbi:Uncharacterized protein QTN25_007533 [Entamoeba marina]